MWGAMDYTACTLCPRACGVNRAAGQLGVCRMPGRLQVAKVMRHEWEEPALAGPGGSGAIFFSGCTLGCLYCQNEEISAGGFGREMSAPALRRTMEELIAQGAENIDLVTPTHFLPDILPALAPKLPAPVVYNCGGYESVETLRHLEGLVDIYLPDLKYADGALAARLSGAADYVQWRLPPSGRWSGQPRATPRRGSGSAGRDDPASDSSRPGREFPPGTGLDWGDLPQRDRAGVPHASIYPDAPGGRDAAPGPGKLPKRSMRPCSAGCI